MGFIEVARRHLKVMPAGDIAYDGHHIVGPHHLPLLVGPAEDDVLAVYHIHEFFVRMLCAVFPLSTRAIFGEAERIYQKLPSFIADSLPDAFDDWRKNAEHHS